MKRSRLLIRRPTGLRWRLLLPVVVVIPMVAAAVGLGYYGLSSIDDASLVQQRSARVMTGLEQRLDDRRRAKEVFAQLVAAQEGLAEAVGGDDPVAVAQLLVPLKARLRLGIVHGAR